MKRSLFMSTAIALGALMVFAGMGWAAEGLVMEIEDVTINNELKPEVTLLMTDNEGNPVQLQGEEENPENVEVRGIIMGYLVVEDAEAGKMYYESYTRREVTTPEDSPNPGATASQATYDSGGSFTDLGDGRYLYVFGTALPEDYDPTLTHTVSGQFERTVEGTRYVANPLFHFVPNGSEVTQLKRVSTNESCNDCHTNLGIHGGARMDYTLCLLCHTPSTIDPDTGNTVEMDVMIHKIHMGENLPSVQAGEPYQIIGYRQSVHDYSHVAYPQDINNCESCHNGPEGEIYKTAVTAKSCGSCHDDVNFETGANHASGIPATDDQCASCHQPSGSEFDISVEGAHTIPLESEMLNGIVAEIQSIEDAAPGQQPSVVFTLQEDDGTPLSPQDMGIIAITYAGPTVEYTSYVREDASVATEEGDAWRYMFSSAIPEDAMGTYAFAIEARREVVLVDNPEGEEDIAVEESAINPVAFAAVTDDQVVQRREIADPAKCNDCHGELIFHGNLRRDYNYCVMCHNPKVDDIRRRPEGVTGGESVSMQYMIHKIHRGEDLNQDYTVYGFGQRAHNYNNLVYPGNKAACSACHVGEDVPSLPLPDEAEPIEFTDLDGNEVFIPPMTAACTSCHDSQDAIDHAAQFTQDDGSESCELCHAEGGSSDISEIHRIDRVLNATVNFGNGDVPVHEWLMY